MKHGKVVPCVVINGTAYRTPHTAATEYSKTMYYSSNRADKTSVRYYMTRQMIDDRTKVAYQRILPIFRKLFKK